MQDDSSGPETFAWTHLLYRLFDTEDRLLYVGRTNDLRARLARHSKTQSWWGEVARSTVDTFSNLEDLCAAEKAAVIAERPRYNAVYNEPATMSTDASRLVVVSKSTIDLTTLTPRAAAIARIWASSSLGSPCPLILESVRTLREMGADPDEVALWWGADAMDRPHRFVLDIPAKNPGGFGQPLPARLEAMAQRLPIGYIPVGGGDPREPAEIDTDDLRADADLLTRGQVSDLLREQGRPVSVQVIANYKANPPAGWPQPVKYVGRTPLWSRADVEAYADSR